MAAQIEKTNHRTLDNLLLVAPKALLFKVLLFGLLLEASGLALPLIGQRLIDSTLHTNQRENLTYLSAALLFLAMLEATIAFSFFRKVHTLSFFIDRHVSEPIVSKIFSLPLNYFESQSKGALISKIRDISIVRDFFSAVTLLAVVDALFVIVIMGVLLSYSSGLGFLMLLSIPCFVGLAAVLSPSIKSEYDKLKRSSESFDTAFAEGLTGFKSLKYLRHEAFWTQLVMSAHQRFINQAYRAKRLAAIEESGLRFVNRIFTALVLIVATIKMNAGELSPGQLFAAFFLATRILTPCTRLFQLGANAVRLRITRQSLEVLLEAPEESIRADSSSMLQIVDIEAKSLSFTYLGHARPCLSDISLKLQAGELCGIVGPSGAGKSTFAHLLQRHFDAPHGHLLVNNKDISEFSISQLRHSILLLHHEPMIFKGTLRENVTFFDPNISYEKLRQACQSSELDLIIKDLPAGLDTAIEESGSSFSTGQKQRIGIARALYLDPSVLILDEATNALDAETEQLVLDNIRNLYTTRILIVITHRPHILTHATTILQLN
jgi:ATP-binding cassette, subfamily B, bacterial HlyB/CyaB